MSKTTRSPVQDLETSLSALAHSKVSPFIRELRFPNFRNIEANAKLKFEFPVTVLLGRNGTNKSSVLQALYGSAKNNTIADFWFETDLDAIPETRDGLKQSVTHTYFDGANEAECIKARAPRSAADPDYWEAVKPTGSYGFAAGVKRASPIQIEVLHLDFRAELSAFDKYFYFPDPSHLKQRTTYARNHKSLRREYRKQDYLRRRSGKLKRLIAEQGKQLTTEELEILRYILERDYESGILFEHSLFHGHQGRTILFKARTLPGVYSDAFAGSGESAATSLVHLVLETSNNSLVLLDEPETSLHPRAQQRMLEFLCHQSQKKSLQVVISTHSIYYADRLPQAAIRVLEMVESGRVRVSTSYSAREALHEIGTSSPHKEVIVEDQRAKHIILSSFEKHAKAALNDIRITVRDGGTSRIFQDIRAHANSVRQDSFVILDGDHRPTKALPADPDLPQGLEALKKLIREFTKGPNEAGPELEFVDAAEATRYIKFLRHRVRFLPGDRPEELIWDDNRVVSLLKSPALPEGITTVTDYKARLRAVADLVPGLDEDAVFKFLVAGFVGTTSQKFNELCAILDEIRDM